MRQRTLSSALAALLVLFAGCTGAPIGDSGSPTPATDAPDGTQSVDGGSVNFYISDEENAIGEFQHLNVTVTKVGFQRAGEGGWVERDVNDTTVDLTELQGANATRIDSYDLPNGTYNKVFVHVGEVNGTLENGEQVRVKLPSEKLQLEKRFTVNETANVDFVFDITVFKAGQSGKYILKPVVSESGTDVPIEDVDARDEDDEREERGDDESELNATFVGEVTQGENATVEVTRNGSAVENATVVVNDESVGTTGSDGRFTFTVPEDAEELEVEITAGDAEAELEREFEDEGTETATQTATATPTTTATPTATSTPTATATPTPSDE